MTETKRRVLIIEDELPAIHLLENLINSRKDLVLAGVARKGTSALKLLEDNCADLALVDIDIPCIDGLTVLQKSSFRPFFIVVSACNTKAIDSLNLGCVDYLLKPFTQERFNQAVDRYFQISRINNDLKTNIISFHERKNRVMLPINSIIYIETRERFTLIHTESKIYQSRKSLREFREELIGYGFIQLHKQFLINRNNILSKIHLGSGKYIVKLLDSEDSEIPIGRAYLKHLKTIFPE